MSPLTIRIPEELARELEKLCKSQDRSASDVVRDSLRRYLAVERFQKLRRETMPYAEAKGFLTDDDVFEAVS